MTTKNTLLIDSSSLMMPDRICPSTWLEHIPFAFWLTVQIKPIVFVELGSYLGASYFAFCQAVQCYRYNTKCYAVDTWKGDDQSGLYDENVYESVLAYNQKKYSTFSTLIRSTFDQALNYFDNHSISILHIDGYHKYDDVKNDFNNWKPKLTDNGIILFHDINIKERDFGVYKLWCELKQKHKHFEFFHGCGLGILGIGDKYPLSIDKLFSLKQNSEKIELTRKYFNRLGSGINYMHLYERLANISYS